MHMHMGTINRLFFCFTCSYRKLSVMDRAPHISAITTLKILVSHM